MIVLLAASMPGSTQEVSPSNGQSIFDPIPADTRSAFIARLQSVVQFQGAHDWAQLYDLLALPKPKLKAKYVANRRANDPRNTAFILEFRPDRLTKFPTAYEEAFDWIVSGCAKYRVGRDIQYHQSSMYALFRDGNWYFSEVGINIRCGPNDPDPCEQKIAVP